MNPRRRQRLSTLVTMLLLLRQSILCRSWSPTTRARSLLLQRQHNYGTTTSITLTRRAASSVALTQDDDDIAQEEPLLNPSTIFSKNPETIPSLASLSPSSILEFQKCPQSFLFQYLYKLKQPANTALAKGSMCHSALEQVFDLPPRDRTLENLQNLLRKEWSSKRNNDLYRPLFESTAAANNDNGAVIDATTRDLEAERAWGLSALKLLENYYDIEDPTMVARPNPVQREIWVKSNLSLDPAQGATGYTSTNVASSKNQHADDKKKDTFLVRGIVDRLDLVSSNDKKNAVALRLTDYKTGKAPHLKYSPAMNQQIHDEAFYQLKIYALLLREKGAAIQSVNTMELRWLRLFYLTSVNDGPAAYMDLDLGATQQERDALLQEIHAELSGTWTAIQELVATQDPTQFVGCDRSFCYCHKCRPKFEPGTVWEPPPEL